MCGFVGVIGHDPPEAVIDDMLDAIPHPGSHEISRRRGRGFHVALSSFPGGRSSSFAFRANTTALFFGYIYALPGDQALPYGWVTSEASGADLVLEAYLHGQVDDLLHLEGIWAAAILDESARRCILLADAFGLDSPYVSVQDDGRVLIGSHMHPFLRYPGFSTEIDRATLLEVAVLNYHDARRTYFRSIEPIVPSTLVHIPLDTPTQFSSVPALDRQNGRVAQDLEGRDWLGRCEQRLRTALRKRGAGSNLTLALSGGVDSGLLAILLAEDQREKLRCFTLFDRRAAPDPRYARRLCRSLELPHDTRRIRFPDFLESLSRAIHVMPGHPPNLSAYYMIESAVRVRNDVEHIMFGDGPEEYVGAIKFAYSKDDLRRALAHLEKAHADDLAASTFLSKDVWSFLDGPENEEDWQSRLISNLETGGFDALLNTADSFGIDCSLPFVDGDFIVEAEAQTDGREDAVDGYLPRLLLDRALPESSPNRHILERTTREPAFFALHNSIFGLCGMLKSRLNAEHFTGDPTYRFGRHVLDLFWIWSMEVLFIQGKCRMHGIDFSDLMNEIEKHVMARSSE